MTPKESGYRLTHRSCFMRTESYYWYGENKEKTTGEDKIWHWGVRCYSSKDLYNWEDRGIIIEPDIDDEKSTLHPYRNMDRPHIIYNRSRKKVCVLAENNEL